MYESPAQSVYCATSAEELPPYLIQRVYRL